jgi:uncharacterized protein (DUF302 family)
MRFQNCHRLETFAVTSARRFATDDLLHMTRLCDAKAESRAHSAKTMDVRDCDYNVRRLNVAVSDVRGFQVAYERAVPDVPVQEISALVAAGSPWSRMVELIDRSAPYGFLIYFRNDVHQVMQAAGDDADCIAYLMGNHTIAERMFRYDPRTMLYAPLHTVIWEDSAGKAWFTVDQPSTQFSSLGRPEIAAVGRDLDTKLAALLDALDLHVPAALTIG